MKIRITRKVILYGTAYLAMWMILVILFDFVFHIEQLFLFNMIAGILTIIGGFILAYWLIERNRIQRETKQTERERECKKQASSALRRFNLDFLLPWLFNYANVLSGQFSMYDQRKIRSGKYKKDIPQLKNIFELDDSVYNEMMELKLAPQFLRNSLEYGLRMLKHIEKELDIFPSLIKEVDPEVREIVHLSEFIRERIRGLNDWETKHDEKRIYTIDSSPHNLAIRHNLRQVGLRAFNIVIAIDTNIEKFEAELESH
jgi:hypothetical protein